MNKTAKGSKTIRANKGKAKLKAKHRRRCCNHMTAAETKDSFDEIFEIVRGGEHSSVPGSALVATPGLDRTA